jgi:photosystem II stability/assembly factor-like uncharacterized protein
MTGCGGPANAAKPLQPRAGCLLSLQMITSTTGWAMPCTGKPGSAGARVARTTDGGRTWRDVTPSPVRALSAPNLSVVLLAADERHAWLAESTYPHAAVYRTADGGRTWNRSALPDAAGYVRLLGHAGLDHAWLLVWTGASMQGISYDVYQSNDGGRRWRHLAPGPEMSWASDVTFATPSAGWLTGGGSVFYTFLVTRDAGRHWAQQALPIPFAACQGLDCQPSAPRFFGATGFMLMSGVHPASVLLVSRDLGASWRRRPLPASAGNTPRMWFFSRTAWLLEPVTSSGSGNAMIPGRDWYLTADGGRTWTAVRQGRRFSPWTTFNFVTPQTGFALVPASAGRSLLFRTTDAGRDWTAITPSI